jgi:uncharacterized protein YbcC (UPF0753/DUF2309 family)
VNKRSEASNRKYRAFKHFIQYNKKLEEIRKKEKGEKMKKAIKKGVSKTQQDELDIIKEFEVDQEDEFE